MDGLAKLPDAFAMDDSNAKNPPFPARLQVVRHELLDYPRGKSVQVQHAVDGQSDGLWGWRFILVLRHGSVTAWGI
jgi:hypothetical protein